MLKQRLITALILIPLVLALLFYANLYVLAIVAIFMLLLCGWEWAKLIPLTRLTSKGLFLVLLLLMLWLSRHYYPIWLSVGLLFWVPVLLAVLFYPASERIWGKPIVVGLSGLLLLPLFIQSLMRLFMLPHGRGLLLCLLFLIWAADIGAYFTGKLCGKHKLIPQVSPGKSWEGVFGGLMLAMMVAAIAYYWIDAGRPVIWLLLALVTVLISILGDLSISVLKRRCHLKDTGALLPGHGGILDRLDSLIAALPLFYCGLTYYLFGG